MKDYMTKEYIENLEIDKMICEDTELYNTIKILKEDVSEENTDRISFAVLTIVINVIIFILRCKPPKGLEAYRILDKKMTNIIRNLVDDKSVSVYVFKQDIVNAFNCGTPDIYYTDKLVKLLRITEDELVGICLHEYGHYTGRHMKTINITNTATGIVIPVLLRELTRQLPAVYTFLLGKILSGMLNSYLRIIIGRPQEYFSDSYAAKKGYGRQLISALSKLDKYVRKVGCKNRTKEECDALIERASKYDEHPKTKDRIESILKSSKVSSIISSGRFELLARFLDRIKGFFRR